MFGRILHELSLLLPARAGQVQQKATYFGYGTTQPNIMKIRRHKMRKMKWRQRVHLFGVQTKKIHLVKKQKSEALFRAQVRELLAELERFDALEYVKETMKMAKKEWHVDAAPSGRKRYPHWSTLMSLEELFGLEKDDFIDKRYGLPSLEDRPILDKLREEYRKNYIVEDTAKLLEKLNKKAVPEIEGGEKIASDGENK